MDVKKISIDLQGVRIKSGDNDLEDGEFEAYPSKFGNKDSYGDVVLKGAFIDSLKEWKASGNVIPVLFGHNMMDPDFNVGYITDAYEDEKGLKVRGKFDLDDSKGLKTYKLVKGRRVSQLSFAYEVLDGAYAKSEELGDYFELRKLKLYEVSVVTIGANQQTEFTGVKSIGSRKSAEEILSVIAGIELTIADIKTSLVTDTSKGEDGVEDATAKAASTNEPVKDEEPVEVKSEEPTHDVSAALSAQLKLLAL